MLNLITQKILDGKAITREDISYIIAYDNVEELISSSHKITLKFASRKFDSCSIINAKSGLCTEDCKWCAQSSHYKTNIAVYPLVNNEKCLKEALHCEKKGVKRFSLVTSGRKPSPNELKEINLLLTYLKLNSKIALCASLGLLNKNDLKKLKESGLSRYHCNLESSENYFKNLCSTHKFSQKIAVIKAAKEVGLEVCSGGIIGMGESMEDRADLALTLRDLEIQSVPLNILHPIPGTPLENIPLLSDLEILKTVALFRFILPHAYLRLAGGRARLSEKTLRQALYAGINSAIVGDLLTTLGSDIDTDKKRFAEAGYEL